ncbi:MAG: hypothetical protein ACFFAJ_16185 [Candidatus Hodarchaeota archaeon]
MESILHKFNGNSRMDQISNAISHYYHQNNLSWVLLVGNEDTIPPCGLVNLKFVKKDLKQL